jgi:hypothetical protein
MVQKERKAVFNMGVLLLKGTKINKFDIDFQIFKYRGQQFENVNTLLIY